MKLRPTYRAYFFTNFYLSDIQKGIQPLHAVGDMAAKYAVDFSDEKNMFIEWATRDKVAIVLNGGNSADLDEIYTELYGCDYPLVKFIEDEESLCCATTCVGIILPNRIWDAPRNDDFFQNFFSKKCENISPHDQWLIENLKRFKLA